MLAGRSLAGLAATSSQNSLVGLAFQGASVPTGDPSQRASSGSQRRSSRLAGDVTVYGERRLVGYTPEQMCGVVAGVEHYFEFVPYCRRSVVTMRQPGLLSANLVVGFPPLLHLPYTSLVTIIHPHLVTAVCRDVALFDHLKTVWKFNPVKEGSGCEIDFAVSFSFLSSSHSTVARLFLDSLVRDNVRAFIDRAESLHGPPSRPSEVLSVVTRKSEGSDRRRDR